MTISRSSKSCLLFLSGLFIFVPASADTISNWNGGSGNWSATGQWTPAIVPNNSTNQSFDVTIGSGTVTLDVSPTINKLILDGNLAEGVDSSGFLTTLTVNGDATVNGSISGPSRLAFQAWQDSLVVGGNLTNRGYISAGGQLTVSGNLNNPGGLTIFTPMLSGGLDVAGTLNNTGNLQIGGDFVNGAAGVGRLTGGGSVTVHPYSALQVQQASPIYIAKGSSWTTSGELIGFGPLNNHGTFDVEGTADFSGNVSPMTFGSTGSVSRNASNFLIYAGRGTSVVNVIGNLSNTGDIEIAQSGPNGAEYGTSTLNISGTLTNQIGGILNVNNTSYDLPFPPYNPLVGSLNAQTLINNGTANFQSGTSSSLQQLTNNGVLNVGSNFPDYTGPSPELAVGTLRTAGGVVTISGGTLAVGTGTAPVGFILGYYQFSNGTLEAAGGSLDVINGQAFLDGTLAIMLGNGYKPIGEVFTVLSAADSVSGTFSNVDGLVFDNGLERYLLSYNPDSVTLTVENNVTPEPASAALMLFGCAGVFALVRIRRRRA